MDSAVFSESEDDLPSGVLNSNFSFQDGAADAGNDSINSGDRNTFHHIINSPTNISPHSFPNINECLSPNSMSHSTSAQGTLNETRERLVVVMIGLPARGKSYLANKLVRYLNWLQINSRIFNVGSTRREKSKVGPDNEPLPDQDASFFSPENKSSFQLREQWAHQTLDSLLDYLLLSDGCVGIFDATNTTVKRRKMVMDTIKKRSSSLKVVFLESICNDPQLIDDNVNLKLKGPDYKDQNPVLAKRDFLGRLRNYEKVYETISKSEEMNKDFQYIQMIDVGRKVIACNINGFLSSQICYYFLNFNLEKRLIFVARHGESVDNTLGKMGGDSSITEKGAKFSIALEKFIDEKRFEFNSKHPRNHPSEFSVFCSLMKRSIESSKPFVDKPQLYDVKQLRVLNELSAGSLEGFTYEQMAKIYPMEFHERINNKLQYRYPGVGGESYIDVINRLKPMINEVERSRNHMLIISHRVTSRILMGYFLNLSREQIVDLDVPLHSVYVFEPKPFGVDWTLWQYDENDDKFIQRDLDKLVTKKVEEVDISFRERKYSVVPTRPTSLKRHQSNFHSSTGSNNSVSGLRRALNEFKLVK